jgi:hypothetical protein
MSQYFIESPTWAYFLLGALAIILVFAFAITRRVLYLGLVPLLAVLALGFFLLDYFVESDREHVVRLTKEMMAAAERNDLEGFGKHISENFLSGSATKAALLQRARPVLPQLKSVRARQFEVVSETMGRILNVACMVDAKGTVDGFPLDDQPAYLKLTFIQDDDGVWRVRRFEVYDALGRTRWYP